MEKVLFLANDTNLKRGSYRIWVNDLCMYFKYHGIEASINDSDNINNYDIVILDKNLANHSTSLKTQYPNKKIGIINNKRIRNIFINFKNFLSRFWNKRATNEQIQALLE